MGLFDWVWSAPALETNVKNGAALVAAAINKNTLAVNDVAGQLKRTNELLARLVGPANPRNFSIKQVGEDTTMGHKMIYQADWSPVSTTADVETIELSVSVDGAAPEVQSLPKDATTAKFGALVGSTVNVSLANVDAAGNKSPHPATLPEFVVSDTLPPPDPSGLSLSVVDEEVTPD